MPLKEIIEPSVRNQLPQNLEGIVKRANMSSIKSFECVLWEVVGENVSQSDS